MNIEKFTEDLGNDLIMVDFYADWCGPCRTLGPMIERISEEKNVKLLKVDADKFKDIAASFSVKGIPTVIFFKEGQEINRVVGLKQTTVYKEIIEKHLI
jgi:thioredoxin 1